MYAHGLDELRDAPELKKVSLCWAWEKYGRCTKGAACTFAHGDNDRRQPSVGHPARPRWCGVVVESVSTEDNWCASDDKDRESFASDLPGDLPEHPCVAFSLWKTGARSWLSDEQRHTLSVLATYLCACPPAVLEAIHVEFGR
jgi:hypothetical protein